jgi:S-adenosylmethionine hydrolase
MAALISLLTDFGIKDPFVGELKAVIFSISPDTSVIDISHDVERFNVRAGAFLLASAAPHFPVGTIHVGVVDPGVGGERRPILVETGHALYVGPDNGLLIPAASREGIRRVYALTNRSLMRDKVSSTFHGRDLFAPVAAHLANGTKPDEVGEEIVDYGRLALTDPAFDRHGAKCEALHVDNFGNIILNISQEQMGRLNLDGKHSLRVRGKHVPLRFVRTFSDLRAKEFGILLGSCGFLEIVCCEASAANRLRIKSGYALRLDGA